MTDIKNYKSFVKIEPVRSGLSGDKKFYIETIDGQRLLLRVADISEYERKKVMYEMMERVAASDVPMSRPVDFGTCDNGKSVYQLLTWCDGENLEAVLPSLSEAEQYAAGRKAGEILRKIHSVPAPDDMKDWSLRYIEANGGRIKAFAECGVQIEGSDAVLHYFEENKHFLNSRPQCFHHGDYHTGNLLITDNHELSVIDWELLDYGNFADPWEEFNRIGNSKVIPHFTTGLIRGYFCGEVPAEFWRLFALYLSAGALMLISWAFYIQQDCLEYSIQNANDVLRWFNNMQNPVPTWYLKDFYIQWIDGVPYKLKASFDFSFLKKYGTVFKVFDNQDSGNICFGVQNGENRYFVKFAGAPTERACVSAGEAVANLKRTVPVYRDLAHPNLVKLVNAEETGGGFAMIFEWADADCMHPMYPLSRQKFMQMSLETRLRVFDDILVFHVHMAKQGYVAIDFYDGSIMYDFNKSRTVICDIDFYEKTPYINNMGRMWGSSRFMSPEEHRLGAAIDEITNVYTMGASAFALFGDERDRCIEKWRLSEKLFDVAKKAVSDERNRRQQSIGQLRDEWRAAK